VTPAWPADVPVDIGRDEAAEAARRELADPIYGAAEPGLIQRALDWLAKRLTELLNAASGAVPGGLLGLVVLALLLIPLVVAVVIGRLWMGWPGVGRTRQPVFGKPRRSAAEHRAAAEAAAARGAYGEAVRDRMRALVADLEQRGVLDERPGRTADEAAAEAGAQLPACAAGLTAAARIFDDVVYGGRPATPQSYAVLVETDRQAHAAGVGR